MAVQVVLDDVERDLLFGDDMLVDQLDGRLDGKLAFIGLQGRERARGEDDAPGLFGRDFLEGEPGHQAPHLHRVILDPHLVVEASVLRLQLDLYHQPVVVQLLLRKRLLLERRAQ